MSRSAFKQYPNVAGFSRVQRAVASHATVSPFRDKARLWWRPRPCSLSPRPSRVASVPQHYEIRDGNTIWLPIHCPVSDNAQRLDYCLVWWEPNVLQEMCFNDHILSLVEEVITKAVATKCNWPITTLDLSNQAAKPPNLRPTNVLVSWWGLAATFTVLFYFITPADTAM